MHAYLIEHLTVEEEEVHTAREKLNRHLVGAMTTLRTAPQPERTIAVPFDPPSWWVDDEEASESSFFAMQEMGGAM